MDDTYKCERCNSVFECSHALDHHRAMVSGGNHCCHRCNICSRGDEDAKCIKTEELERQLAMSSTKLSNAYNQLTGSVSCIEAYIKSFDKGGSINEALDSLVRAQDRLSELENALDGYAIAKRALGQ